MKINLTPINKANIYFKGHEAKKLDAFYIGDFSELGSNEIFKQLDAIAKNHGIKIHKTSYRSPWIQDVVTFTHDKRVISKDSKIGRFLANRHGIAYDEIKEKNAYFNHHISGGNLLYVTDKFGKQVILTARNTFGDASIDGYEDFYNVDKIIVLPHADFHADLFLTPIGDNKVLVASDRAMIKGMVHILSRAYSYINQNPDDPENHQINIVIKNILTLFKDFTKQRNDFFGKGNDDESAKILEENGFEVIRVPSRLYTSFRKVNDKNTKLCHRLNYSNALTFKNNKNEPVLILGKSDLNRLVGITDSVAKKLGADFDKNFIDSLKHHVKPENIYFINGDKDMPIYKILEELKGGLHCMCAELPKYE